MIVLACVTCAVAKVDASSVYYKEYDFIEDTYSEPIYYTPKCFDELNDEEREHFWELENTKKATGKKEGYKEYSCFSCDWHKFVTIPKLKKAEKTVSDFLKAGKKYNYKKMNKCFAKKGKKYSFKKNKRYMKCLKKINKKLSWKVVSSKGTDKKCQVKVRIKIPNLGKDIKKIAVKEFKREYTKNGDFDAYKCANKTFDKFIAKIKKYKGKTKTKTIVFPMVKKNGKWKIKKKTNAIEDVVIGLYHEGLKGTKKPILKWAKKHGYK